MVETSSCTISSTCWDAPVAQCKAHGLHIHGSRFPYYLGQICPTTATLCTVLDCIWRREININIPSFVSPLATFMLQLTMSMILILQNVAPSPGEKLHYMWNGEIDASVQALMPAAHKRIDWWLYTTQEWPGYHYVPIILERGGGCWSTCQREEDHHALSAAEMDQVKQYFQVQLKTLWWGGSKVVTVRPVTPPEPPTPPWSANNKLPDVKQRKPNITTQWPSSQTALGKYAVKAEWELLQHGWDVFIQKCQGWSCLSTEICHLPLAAPYLDCLHHTGVPMVVSTSPWSWCKKDLAAWQEARMPWLWSSTDNSFKKKC